MSIRVLHMGLGPIGAAVVKQVAQRQGFRSVGAVDIDPAKVGKDLGTVIGLDKKLKVTISDDIRKAIKATKPDVVALCTSSSLEKILPQIEAITKAKVPIVSTTEELSYPYYSNKKLAKQIDKLPLPCVSAPGFLVNRVLSPYLLEAMLMLDDGIPAETIDAAARDFGMPMGPIELADMVGLDIAAAVGQELAKPDTPIPNRCARRREIATP